MGEYPRLTSPGRMLLNVGGPTVPTAAREPVGDTAESAPVSGNPAEGAVAPGRTEPSWGRVLATTVKLWMQWRLRSAGFVRQRESGRQSRGWFRRRPEHPRPLTAWRLVASLVAGAVIAVVALALAGVFAVPAAPAARVSSAGTPSAGTAVRNGVPSQASAAAQTEAAAWIADQASSDAIIVCDPAMCAALLAQGVTAGQLMPLRPGSADPRGAAVVVTSASADSQLTDEYAPAVIASFGSGDSRIDVRATEPGGVAGYESALRADRAARMSAGSQLLQNSRIRFTAQDAAELRAAEVDSRVLATLAALSSQYSFRVTAFGDASPGVQVLYREVTIASDGSRDGTAELAAALALAKAQDQPYLPAHAMIVHPGTDQAALSIQFAAPSPLGLLTAVLEVDRSPSRPARQ